MTSKDAVTADTTDLVISRLLGAARAGLLRAWTEPELLPAWWCPRPWTTEVRAFDLRPGGAFHTFMRCPDRVTRDRRERMGFFDGWNICMDQLEAFARTLR